MYQTCMKWCGDSRSHKMKVSGNMLNSKKFLSIPRKEIFSGRKMLCVFSRIAETAYWAVGTTSLEKITLMIHL